jgi:hypothetical protein
MSTTARRKRKLYERSELFAVREVAGIDGFAETTSPPPLPKRVPSLCGWNGI